MGAGCLMFVICCLECVVCCLMADVCCYLFVGNRLFGVRCGLLVVRCCVCLLVVACCFVFGVPLSAVCCLSLVAAR